MTVTQAQIIEWLCGFAALVNERVDEFNRLDAAIGDGDFGASVQRGYNAAVEQMPSLHDADMGTLLRKTGMRMMSVMGGTSGPLTGTFYVQMGGKLSGKMVATSAEITTAFTAAVAGVMKLGKAQVGDKTMIDALKPAVDAMQTTLSEDASATVPQVLAAGMAAAEAGYRSTGEIAARKGRASYVGDRSLGNIDPGAFAAYLLIKQLHDTVVAVQ